MVKTAVLLFLQPLISWNVIYPNTHTHALVCPRPHHCSRTATNMRFDLILLLNRRTCSCSSSGRRSVFKWVWWNKPNAVILAHPFLVKQSKEALAVYVLHYILHLGWGSWCISPHRSWGARWGAGSTYFLLASGHRFSLCTRAGWRGLGINKRVALLSLTLSVLTMIHMTQTPYNSS